MCCDLEAGFAVPGYEPGRWGDVEACREGRRLRVRIPVTERNDMLVGFARDPQGAVRFNGGVHTAEAVDAGAVVMRGKVRLVESSEEGYVLEIRDGGAAWAQNAAQRMFNTLGVDYAAQLTPTTICQSWTDDSPVKFFPILRDEYPQRNSSGDLLPAERMLSVDDYHPFLHVATLVETIFSEAGYTLHSGFFGSELFRSLYMSGAYASRDTTAADNRMGFFARRLAEAGAEADFRGRVAADPKALANTVGNIVETATPQTVDADGEPIPELRNNGGCFGVENGKIVFRPTTDVRAGFEFYLRYTTDHRILDRERLRGFDSVYLGPGSDMAHTLANRYADRRGKIAPGYSYRAIVFSHTAGAQYRLVYTRNGVEGSVWTEFAGRSAAVATPAGGSVGEPVLEVRSGTAWVVYGSDWALYDGHIGETGQTTVELRVRTASEAVGPSSPKFFNQVYFYGAEPGMRLVLHKQSSLRPRFAQGPGFGEAIRFGDVARHRIRQSELLEAVAHLFNLRFLTDEAEKTVWVEPEADFAAGEAVDWTDRTDFSQPVVLADIAQEVHERRVWGYGTGDGAMTRWEAEAGERLADWEFRVASQAAKEGTKELRNGLFRASLNVAGEYLNAPSARILKVGDRDSAADDGQGITPRIVRYAGMKPLAGGERWGSPWGQASYPLAAFHAPEEGFTLCFEDRDGAPGLHRFYDRQVTSEAVRERITLSLRVASDEFGALAAPAAGNPSVRSVFRIDTGQGEVCAILHTVGAYDPEAGSVRCVFTRLPGDQ